MKLAAEHGDDLQVIFVESQGRMPAEGVEAFIWDHKWMGTSAIWTSERPLDTGTTGLPNCALLSNEGEVLMMGNPLAMHSDIEKAIEAEIKKANEVPDDVPKALKKAWKSFLKKDYAKAVEEARKVEADGGADGEAATQAIATFVERVESELARGAWMIENGYYLEADEHLDDLDKRIEGIEATAETFTELTQKLEGDDLKEEFDAAKLLGKLLDTLAEDGYDDKIVKKLEKFAEKSAGTKAAERAAHLVKIYEHVD